MTVYPGSCHCGAVQIRLESTKQPAEMPDRPLRLFLLHRRHGARTMGDPGGSVEFRADAAAVVGRYRFGLGIA